MSDVAVVAHQDKVERSTMKAVKEALVDHGHVDALWIMVDKGPKAKAAAKKARKAGARTVLVCGGDGTVRAAAEALAGTDVALAVVPTGTANLFAGALSLPTDPADVVALIASGSQRVLDTGVCNGQTFNVMAGTGFDAGMIDAADDDKERMGTLAYVRAGVREARHRDAFDAEVTLDGAELFDGAATCVLIGNIGTLKGGVEAFPDASPTDGVLDIAVVTAAGLREWASVMWSAVRGRQELSGLAHLGRGTEISVRLASKQRFELDGGSKGTTRRLDVSIEPSSLRVCAPATT